MAHRPIASAPATLSSVLSNMLLAVNENTANIRNTVNRYSAIGETNFARS